MHYELEIAINNEYFDVNVNYNIIKYLRQFNTTNKCRYCTKLTNYIKNLNLLVKQKKEKKFIEKITEHAPIDILEHVRF